MSNIKNRRWVLANYPDGMPDADTFRLEEDLNVPELKDGQVLLADRFLSVDPYMRGRISPAKQEALTLATAALWSDGFSFTEVQTNHILNTQLGDLVGEVSNPELRLTGDLPINV